MANPAFISSEQQIAQKTVGPRSVHHILTDPLTDGEMMQRGQANVGTVTSAGEKTTAVTFTKPFSTATYAVYLTTASTTTSFAIFNRSNAKATTGFNILSSNSGVSDATGVLVDWIAIGQ